jgi:excisionase family DNA binding protein
MFGCYPLNISACQGLNNSLGCVRVNNPSRGKGTTNMKKAESTAALRATLTARETADTLGIGLNQVYDGIKSGEIPSFRVGKRIIIPRAAIEKKLAGAA